MEYKFVAVNYGIRKLTNLEGAPEDLTYLNNLLDSEEETNPLSKYLKAGWKIKQFFVYSTKEGKPVFIFLLEK